MWQHIGAAFVNKLVDTAFNNFFQKKKKNNYKMTSVLSVTANLTFQKNFDTYCFTAKRTMLEMEHNAKSRVSSMHNCTTTDS